jgi:DNA adenine methylase
MNVSPTASKRPLVRYPGSKMRLAPWLLQHVPDYHHTFNAPYGGSAIEFILKEPSRMEAYNDLNGDMVHLLRTLRERPDELIRAISMTYWARAEWELALEPTADPVERARRFYVRCWMSIKPFDKWPSFRRQRKFTTTAGMAGGMTPAAKSFVQVDHLYTIAERLKPVMIEQQDAIKFIEDFDYDRAFFYCDPPYPHDTRQSNTHYEEEMSTADHILLAQTLRNIDGMAVVCGYPCNRATGEPNHLYRTEFEDHGWVRVDREGVRTLGTNATESLWLSPKTVQKLAEEADERRLEPQMSLL